MKPKEELKTLKELEIGLFQRETSMNTYKDTLKKAVLVKDLRKEAIKWVKKMKTGGFSDVPRNLFRDFFNLTEEDLK